MMATAECFISAYGTLRRHPWIGSGSETKNGFELLNAYGEQMRWGRTGGDPGKEPHLWVLHDAGWDWSDDVRTRKSHLLWAQTSLTPLATEVVLPIVQLGTCLEKSLLRVGEVSLAGIQVLLPIAASASHSPRDISHIQETADPTNSCVVDIEVDGGDDETHLLRAAEIIADLKETWHTYGIRLEHTFISESASYLLEEPSEMTRVGWLGTSSERMRMRVSVPEFSIEIGCYLTDQIARSAHLAGVTSSLLVTLLRSENL